MGASRGDITNEFHIIPEFKECIYASLIFSFKVCLDSLTNTKVYIKNVQ